jgi:hypothetical protein
MSVNRKVTVPIGNSAMGAWHDERLAAVKTGYDRPSMGYRDHSIEPEKGRHRTRQGLYISGWWPLKALTGLLARCLGMRSLTAMQARWRSSKNEATSMSLVRAVDKPSNATGSQTVSLHGMCSPADLRLNEHKVEQRLYWSSGWWSPPPESNRRPHPYHGSAAKRRANSPSRRSHGTREYRSCVLSSRLSAHGGQCGMGRHSYGVLRDLSSLTIPRQLSAGGQLRASTAAGSNGPRAGTAPLSSVACLGGVVESSAAVGCFLDEVM